MTNAGPEAAADVALSDSVPADTTFVSLTAPAGWTCVTPAAGGTGTISCTNPSLAMGTAASFTLVVNVATVATRLTRWRTPRATPWTAGEAAIDATPTRATSQRTVRSDAATDCPWNLP